MALDQQSWLEITTANGHYCGKTFDAELHHLPLEQLPICYSTDMDGNMFACHWFDDQHLL